MCTLPRLHLRLSYRAVTSNERSFFNFRNILFALLFKLYIEIYFQCQQRGILGPWLVFHCAFLSPDVIWDQNCSYSDGSLTEAPIADARIIPPLRTCTVNSHGMSIIALRTTLNKVHSNAATAVTSRSALGGSMRRCNTAANQGMLSSQAVEPGSSLPNPWTLQSRSSQWGHRIAVPSPLLG